MPCTLTIVCFLAVQQGINQSILWLPSLTLGARQAPTWPQDTESALVA